MLVPESSELALVAELGRRHRLWGSHDPVTVLARGGENTSYAVGDLIVRRAMDSDALAREVALLRALAGASAVATPEPVLHDPELGALAYRRLPGQPLLEVGKVRADSVTAALVEVLGQLRAVAPGLELPVDEFSAAEWHGEAGRAFRSVRGALGEERAALVQRFLDGEPPPEDLRTVPQHNDLGAEHILVDESGQVTGVIDWTDAALTSPSRDGGTLYRDLGSAVALAVSEALDGPLTEDDRRRIAFHARCKWLEDLAYALAEPVTRADYLANAWRTFAQTFGPTPT